MRGSRKTHTEKPCDICGDSGFTELIVTCSQCKISREHIYCMQVLLEFVPEIWFCGECCSGRCIVTRKPFRNKLCTKALESNTSKVVHSDMSRSVGSRRFIKESGSSGHLKKQISMGLGTAGGKFIPNEKSVKISSGAQKVATYSTMAPIEFKSPPPKFSLQKVKETYESEPIENFKLPGHGGEEISSITKAQESKSSTELKYKATPIEYKNQNLCKKESLDAPRIKFPGGNLCADAKPKKSVDQGCDLLNIFPKPEINLPIHPVLDATWCGSLKILDKVSCSQFFDGFRAHLAGKVHRKALKYSKFMPKLLLCTLLPCCNVWTEIFQNDSPTVNDIALFFFPGNSERSKQQYLSLLGLLEMQDMVLSSLINGVNLLIFSSKRLHLDSCGLKMQSFLWGVYRPAKGHLAVPPTSYL